MYTDDIMLAADAASVTDMAVSVLLGLLPMLLLLLAGAIVMGVLCRKLASRKGYKGYFFTGFFLGVIGLLYVIGLPDLNLRRDLRAVMKRMVAASERIGMADAAAQREYY